MKGALKDCNGAEKFISPSHVVEQCIAHIVCGSAFFKVDLFTWEITGVLLIDYS